MRKVNLQAHKGVCTDYPENTMSAFRASVCQNYDIIELDLGITKDKKIVVLHDDTINRTGRNSDGTPIEREINIKDITYAETLSYDFGCWFSNKFKGEPIPLFSNVDVICITDHCDIEFSDKIDYKQIVLDSNRDAKKHNDDGPLSINAGVEIGETFWNMEETEKIVRLDSLDQIIGSVHGVRYDGYSKPYAQIDFSKMDIDTLKNFLSVYFDDVITLIERTNFDILAHLTCPLRYINGKYDIEIDCNDLFKMLKKIGFKYICYYKNRDIYQCTL